MSYRFLFPAFVTLLGISLLPIQVHAQSITAASDGIGTSVIEGAIGDFVIGTGDYLIEDGQAITSDNGEINLFHSFDNFNLTTGERAIFNSPNGVTNIVGRITDGSPSLIDGSIIVDDGSGAGFL